MLVDVQLRKESYQNALRIVDSEVFVGQSGNNVAFLKASNWAHHRSLADLSHCRVESVFSGACSWQRASRGFDFFSMVIAAQALSRAWPSRLRCSKQQPVVSHRRRAAPFKPPTSRAATDQLTSRFSLVTYKRNSCWKSCQPLKSPSHCGCPIGTPCSRSVFVIISSFQRASLAVAGIHVWLRYHCGTRACSVSVSKKSATRVFRTCANRKLFGQGACESCRRVSAGDE